MQLLSLRNCSQTTELRGISVITFQISSTLFFIQSSYVLPAMEVCGLAPVLMSMKVPVPMVIFTSPTSKQHSPNMAAC